MAILPRSTLEVQGKTIGPLKEKVLLYADDTLLYLRDDEASLRMALAVIDRFGHYSVCASTRENPFSSPFTR